MVNLVLCGGIGSRLWPLSRTRLPKQFARILPGESLFEATVRRNRSLCEQVMIAANRDQAFLAANQLRHLGFGRWGAVIEPEGRNTAPAIALAALLLPPEEILLVCPSDHVIKDTKAYETAVRRAMELAAGGGLVCFGIKPDFPETGFGYIQTEGPGSEKVLSFKEKPDLPTAQGYVDSGAYLWNSGIFCFQAGVYLAELERLAPEVYRFAVQVAGQKTKNLTLEPDLEAMRRIPAISIDYAVLEKSDKVVVVPCSIGWSDLGSFDALYDHLADKNGNAFVGEHPPLMHNSHRNLVLGSSHLVALLDVDDLIVVQSPDALLVGRRGSSQGVKHLVEALKERELEHLHNFPRVERPWGSYTTLERSKSYVVGRVEVQAGKRVALQRHQRRQEHWTVVHGRARVVLGDRIVDLDRGQSVDIPPGLAHRLENPGNELLVVLETRTGEYIGEDDIERLDDDYSPSGLGPTL